MCFSAYRTARWWGAESGEVLHQSFSQEWASLNREAVEESGKLGEVRLAAVGRMSTVTSSGDVLDALWGPEVKARPSDGLGRRPDG